MANLPATRNFTIWAGTLWEYDLLLKIDNVVVDLSSHTAKLTVRKTVDSTHVELELDNEITLTAGGHISWRVDDSVTANIDPDTYWYSLSLCEPSGDWTPPLLVGELIVEKWGNR